VPLARRSGILLHPTSLPGRSGIGELGGDARAFVDFLADTGQRLWQVLPLGPTGYGDSPYQCFSAFAGNPLLISLESLVDESLLSPRDLDEAPASNPDQVDYGSVIAFKLKALRHAFETFRADASAAARADLEAFCRRQAAWLDGYALYAAVKAAHGHRAWTEWEAEIAAHKKAAVEHWTRLLAAEVEARKFWQFLFFRQWEALRSYCRERGVQVMGDVPIFVAHDSADVWSNRELFQLRENGRPAVQAGVPPDYFSATGQLWGNPLYRWDTIAGSGYRWWIERLRTVFSLVDVVRLDHFRGFEAYWEVPGTATVAVKGRWVKGPGRDFFEALRRSLGTLPIVAENLGVITPEVEALREEFGFPGMAILQFAFGGEGEASDFLPHNWLPNRVAYTGTHDNDTTVGWWTAGVGDSTRTEAEVRRERAFALKYMASDGREIHWDLIRLLIASVAATVIIPLQDVLGLGSEARMNLPGRPSGNWRWRYRPEALTAPIRERLRDLTRTYGR
jgi:4-alpha-glucanotransferase